MSKGKFLAGVATRQRSRWKFQLIEPLSFNDEKLGLIEVPAGFISDLASIRVLRAIAAWTALTSVLSALFLTALPWVAGLLWAVATLFLALFMLVSGYGMRAAILHDWMYRMATLPRHQCDEVYLRALNTGDGLAKWRCWIFYWGVRIGGSPHYGLI